MRKRRRVGKKIKGHRPDKGGRGDEKQRGVVGEQKRQSGGRGKGTSEEE